MKIEGYQFTLNLNQVNLIGTLARCINACNWDVITGNEYMW
jgi:hypothetical protein